ncbi:hypothetical protein B5E84_09435 [Lachnoclostridium sp. An14]|nr:hypothetical protein B5E84_09435 [Lachnoclostridium sp. An14]
MSFNKEFPSFYIKMLSVFYQIMGWKERLCPERPFFVRNEGGGEELETAGEVTGQKTQKERKMW